MRNKTMSTLGILASFFVLLAIMVAGCTRVAGPARTDVNTIETKMVHVNDVDISYKEMGKGYPLILIMGFSGTMEMWSPVMLEGLAENNRVIMFDNRGIGGTTASDRKFTIELFAADTAGFMDALNIKSANILGWSMGTYVAQELALSYPAKVNRLVLFAADCGGKEAIPPSQEIVAMLADTSGTPDDRGNRLMGLLLPERWLEKNPDPQMYMQKITETASAESTEGQFVAMMEWNGTYSRLSDLTQKTLLLTGTEDVLTPPQNSLMMAEKIPGAWLVQYANGGHGVMFQNPKEIAQVTNVFLSERN